MATNTIINVPVKSVNGSTGNVILDYTSVGAAQDVHTHSEYIEDAPVDGSSYVRKDSAWELLTASSGGDMTKAVYDTDDSGVVDNAESLSGNDIDFILSRSNHTGTQEASTISDFDYAVTNNISVVANTAKVGFVDSNLDGFTYGRNLGSWTRVTEEAPSDGTSYVRNSGGWVSAVDTIGVPEAPSNGITYGRKDEDWVEITSNVEDNVLLEVTTDYQELVDGVVNVGANLHGKILVISILVDLVFTEDLDLTKFYNGRVRVTSISTLNTNGYQTLMGNANFEFTGGIWKDETAAANEMFDGANLGTVSFKGCQFWKVGSTATNYYIMYANGILGDISIVDCNTYVTGTSNFYYVRIDNGYFTNINFADCGALGTAIDYLVYTTSGSWGAAIVHGATTFYNTLGTTAFKLVIRH